MVKGGVAVVGADVSVVQARTGRAGNDLARLCRNVAETNGLVSLGQRQVAVIDAGEFRQGRPSLDGHLAVGFRGQGQNHFGRVNGAVDLRPPLADTGVDLMMIELTEEFHFIVGVPVDARSEEQTSELQSLMRISYAVFCLKKNIHYIQNKI